VIEDVEHLYAELGADSLRDGPVIWSLQQDLFQLQIGMVEAAGVELFHHFENSEVIDSKKRPKRQNRYFRRFEVHGGYTDAGRTGQAKTLRLRSGLQAPNIAVAFLAAAVTPALARSVYPVF
jgi:hypothetical protein